MPIPRPSTPCCTPLSPQPTACLLALPGIGDWTAQYIAMRALRWPDAFVASDVALQKALGVRHAKHPAKEAEAAPTARIQTQQIAI